MYVTLRSSTCFEQHPAHPQEDKLYYHSLWYRHYGHSYLNTPLHVSMQLPGYMQRSVEIRVSIVTIPEAVVIQFVLLRMSRVLLETC